MKKSSQKVPKGTMSRVGTARERARQISNSPPLRHPRLEIDENEGQSQIVHDGSAWPNEREPVDDVTAAVALGRGGPEARREASKTVARYLREAKRVPGKTGQVAISYHVAAKLADMIDPPENCVLPFHFEFRPSGLEPYKLMRYREIGRHCLAVKGKGKLTAAVFETMADLGVSERDVYRGLDVISGKIR